MKEWRRGHSGYGEDSQKLRTSLRDIAEQIVALVEDLEVLNPRPTQTKVSDAATRARNLQRLRAKRERIFGASLFGEPAWDILLDLYVSEANGREECVSNACLASRVPPTTALRWLRGLEEQGWISRRADDADRRRTLVKLTPKARDAMDRFFGQPELQRFAAE